LDFTSRKRDDILQCMYQLTCGGPSFAMKTQSLNTGRWMLTAKLLVHTQRNLHQFKVRKCMSLQEQVKRLSLQKMKAEMLITVVAGP